jgi:hypothetical protein
MGVLYAIYSKMTRVRYQSALHSELNVNRLRKAYTHTSNQKKGIFYSSEPFFLLISSSVLRCCGNIIYTQAPPHIVQGTLLPCS